MSKGAMRKTSADRMLELSRRLDGDDSPENVRRVLAEMIAEEEREEAGDADESAEDDRQRRVAAFTGLRILALLFAAVIAHEIVIDRSLADMGRVVGGLALLTGFVAAILVLLSPLALASKEGRT